MHDLLLPFLFFFLGTKGSRGDPTQAEFASSIYGQLCYAVKSGSIKVKMLHSVAGRDAGIFALYLLSQWKLGLPPHMVALLDVSTKQEVQHVLDLVGYDETNYGWTEAKNIYYSMLSEDSSPYAHKPPAQPFSTTSCIAIKTANAEGTFETGDILHGLYSMQRLVHDRQHQMFMDVALHFSLGTAELQYCKLHDHIKPRFVGVLESLELLGRRMRAAKFESESEETTVGIQYDIDSTFQDLAELQGAPAVPRHKPSVEDVDGMINSGLGVGRKGVDTSDPGTSPPVATTPPHKRAAEGNINITRKQGQHKKKDEASSTL